MTLLCVSLDPGIALLFTLQGGGAESAEGDNQTGKGFSEVGLGQGGDELFLTFDLFFNLDLSFLRGLFLNLSCLCRLLP